MRKHLKEKVGDEKHLGSDKFEVENLILNSAVDNNKVVSDSSFIPIEFLLMIMKLI